MDAVPGDRVLDLLDWRLLLPPSYPWQLNFPFAQLPAELGQTPPPVGILQAQILVSMDSP